MLLGVIELVAPDASLGSARARRPLPLCVLATPYGSDIVAYYKLMLVDAPFAPILREWQSRRARAGPRRCSGSSRSWPPGILALRRLQVHG